VAARATATCPNVRIIHAGVSRLPYPAGTFDLVAAVGVLHHVPDTAAAIVSVAELVKPGGRLFLYLYYQLEGRPLPYRSAFFLAQGLRHSISRLPRAAKLVVCEFASVGIYGPLVLLARFVRHLAPRRGWHEHIPLHYYIDKPWKIIRNDALDRLGTPLERRFSKAEIMDMLERAGFEDVRFAEAMPRWRVTARKPDDRPFDRAS
jgi:SAM-dependent methyltransferase